jgi:peptide/nickel transport system permease protein
MDGDPAEPRAAESPVHKGTDALGPRTAATTPPADHEIGIRPLGQWQIVWLRFRSHRLAVWAARFLVLVVALAVIGPSIAPHLPAASLRSLNPYVSHDHPPRLWPFDLRTVMGVDQNGFWISSYVFMGGRGSLVIGIGGAVLAGAMGCLIGGVSGYFGGLVDAALMRVVDALLTVPFLPLLMVLSAYLTNRSMLVFAALFGLFGWAGIARLIRSSVLSLREREFIEAARALGVSDAGVILRHVLPNTLDILAVACTLNVAVFILANAALDFVGVGPSDITWSTVMNADNGDILHLDWWIYAFPGACILLTALSINFVGDGLRDALDTSTPAPVFVRGRGSLAEGGRRNRPVRLILRGPILFAGVVWETSIGVAGRVWTPAQPKRRRGHLAPVQLAAAQTKVVPRGRRLAIVFAPVALLFLASGGVFLYGHSPLLFSPYYSSPLAQTQLLDYSEYGAVGEKDGGWSLAVVNTAGHVEFVRTDARGAALQTQVLAGNAQPSAEPALAMQGSQGLETWVTADNRTIMAEHVGSNPSAPFALVPLSAQVEHPYVVSRRDGGYDVLFQRGTRTGASYDIYLARVPAHGVQSLYLRRLTHVADWALFPRGVYDGRGHLDVMYLNRPSIGYWDLEFLRLNGSGRVLGKPQVLDHLEYDRETIPDRWGIAMARAGDGSIWAAWDGNGVTSVARWSALGRMIVSPTITIGGGVETSADLLSVRALGLAVTNNGGVLYHWAPGQQELYVAAYGFNRKGQAVAPAGYRIAYSAGGSATDPHGATVHGRPVVIWELIRGNGSGLLQSSVSHPYQPPDLATRLGLNIGNLYGNIAFVVFGSLAFGAVFAVINLLAIAVLSVLWFPLGRLLPRRLAWPAYAVVLTLGLLWLFARQPDTPSGVFIISGLGWPYGLIAALGGGFVAWWAGRWFFARQDAVFRAVSMAATGFYFVAGMYAVIFIEGQIGKI